MLYKRLLKKINQLTELMSRLTDVELQSKTEILKEKIHKNIREEDIVVEAFAIMREADYRVLGLFPTDEQILGGLVLYYGQVAEIKTGEGKSLVATLPLYLKSLYVGTVLLVTTNDYLAHRDYYRIGKVYEWMGLTVSDGTKVTDDEKFDIESKKIIYQADIIYISNGTLGFDFLIDGLAETSKDKFIAQLKYAILDEVDEILLDNAQMPLIISGAPKIQSNYFVVANEFVKTLTKGDYKIDEEHQNTWLTELGIEKAKFYFSIPNLLEKPFFPIYQHIILALRANIILQKNKDYVVDNGKIKLLDKKNGRILEGTNLQSGLHQAIQAKESVEFTPETQTISSVTYQNLFRQFRELSGMSGTAKIAESEFIDTYNLPVKIIKPNKKNIRIDHKPQQYVTHNAKVEAVLKKVVELYQHKRPILIIAGSVETSELFSIHLLNLGIPHNVLNAKSSVKEAEIIHAAGKIGAVTIATAMAGRGTDIKISEEAILRGGLAVIITERMLNKRSELQAKGRSGRQGEPGDTYQFESLEDEIITVFVQEIVQSYYDKNYNSNIQIKRRKIRRSFDKAQKKSEERGYSERSKALQFDEVLRIQKTKVDKSRNKILDSNSIDELTNIIYLNFKEIINQEIMNGNLKKVEQIERFILDNIDYNFKRGSIVIKEEETREFIFKIIEINLKKKRERIADDQVFLEYLKLTVLKAIDVAWSNQVDAMNQIKFIIQGRSLSNKPLLEFEKEARSSYKLQQNKLALNMLRNINLSLLEIKKGELIITFP